MATTQRQPKLKDAAGVTVETVASEEIVSGDKPNIRVEDLGSDPNTLVNGDLWIAGGIFKIRTGGSTIATSVGAELLANKNTVSGYPGLDADDQAVGGGFALELYNDITNGSNDAGEGRAIIAYESDNGADAPPDFRLTLQKNPNAETGLAGQAGTIPVMENITPGDKPSLILPVDAVDPSTIVNGDIWTKSNKTFNQQQSGIKYAVTLSAGKTLRTFTSGAINESPLDDDDVAALIEVSATDGNGGTLALPSAAAINEGREFDIVRTDAQAGTITVSNAVEKSGGAYLALATQYEAVRVRSTGSVWVVVGGIA
jgi:hypothetical protein